MTGDIVPHPAFDGSSRKSCPVITGPSQFFTLIDQETGALIAWRAVVADRWWNRLRGLLGRTGLDEGEALVLFPCSAIHTLGMRFPIDVLFLDGKGMIRCARRAVPPWRIGPICRSSLMAVELPAGTIDRYGLGPGRRLYLQQSCRDAPE